VTSEPGPVAVVVVTYQSEPLLPDLITSLGPGLAGLSWHLVVADNNSTDGTVGALRRLAPQATVVRLRTNRGYAAGINAAVAAAGPFHALLVLNPDVRLAPGSARSLLAALRIPGTGIAAPRLVDGDGELIPSMRRDPSILRVLGDALLGAERAGRVRLLGENVVGDAHYEAETVTAWAEGSTLMISEECWRACGPWDESYFLYSEETDFALRARDTGFATRFTPAAHAVHLGGDSRTSPELWTLLIVNRLRLYRSRHSRLRSEGFRLALLLRELSRAALGRAPNWAAARALLGVPAAATRSPVQLGADGLEQAADPTGPQSLAGGALAQPGRGGVADPADQPDRPGSDDHPLTHR
jgi:N-acetylglucosaminyl-diphospho-decaprenol L-rhamnosyltransferase